MVSLVLLLLLWHEYLLLMLQFDEIKRLCTRIGLRIDCTYEVGYQLRLAKSTMCDPLFTTNLLLLAQFLLLFIDNFLSFLIDTLYVLRTWEAHLPRSEWRQLGQTRRHLKRTYQKPGGDSAVS